MRKVAFTLIELMLTLTITSAIIFTMVTLFKPSDQRNQSLKAFRAKMYSEMDIITDLVLLHCSKGKLNAIYDNCNRSNTTHTFGADNGAKEKAIYKTKMIGSDSGCTDRANSSYIQLKNKACVYFSTNNIFVDVNGPQGPNDTSVDQLSITVGVNGITSEAP